MDKMLKPCPFCGGDAKEFTGEDAAPHRWTVECDSCGAHVGSDTRHKARAKWNRRAERTCRMVHDHLTDTVFCDVCGERFDSVAQYMAMVPKGLSVTEYEPEYKDARYCPHCGARIVKEEA